MGGTLRLIFWISFIQATSEYDCQQTGRVAQRLSRHLTANISSSKRTKKANKTIPFSTWEMKQQQESTVDHGLILLV